MRPRPALACLLLPVALPVAAGCVRVEVDRGEESHHTDTYEISRRLNAIYVDASAGDVTIDGTGEDEGPVRVTERIHGRGERVRTSHEVRAGAELYLTYAPCDGCSVDYEITAPSSLATKVRIGAGDIAVRGTAGDLDLRTGAGDVRAVDVELAAATLRSSAGDVELDYTLPFRPPDGDPTPAPLHIDAQSEAGDVTVRLPDATYAVDAGTSAGGTTVEVRTNPAAPRRVRVRSEAGDVAVLPAG